MILIVGKNGQLATALQKQLKFPSQALGAKDFNVTDTGKISTKLDSLKPKIIINSSGMHDAEGVEKDLDRSTILNVRAPVEMATWAAKNQALMIQFTGVDVFDGKGSEFRQESEKVSPLNSLGKQFVEAETQIHKLGGAHLIFRLSWLYSAVGTNFVKTLLKSAVNEFPASVEQVSSPTAAMEVARGVSKVLEKIQGLATPSGIYHMTAHGTATQYEWAQETLSQALGLGFRTVPHKIVQQKKSEPSAGVLRPVNARMSNQKLLKSFGVQLPNWQESLLKTLHELKKTSG